MNTSSPFFTSQSLRGLFPAFMLAVGACAVDVATPLGVAVGVLFVLPVMATFAIQQSSTTLIMAAVSTILIYIGYLVSPEGGEYWKVVSNRLISIVAVWVTYGIVIKSIREHIALEVSENNNRLIVESAPNGMMMVMHNGTIDLPNPQMEQMFGYTREEFLKLAVEHLVPERHQSQHSVQRASFFSNPLVRATGKGRELIAKRKDGTEFPVEIGLTPITMQNGIVALCTILDITERCQARQEIEEQTAKLELSNQELDDFAYIASHDLKEPLRGIQNYSKFLLEGYGPQLNEDAQAKCATLIKLSTRMTELIDSLLYFSRLGRTELAIRTTDLQVVVDDVLTTLDIRLKECGVTVRIPHPLPTVICDQVRVGEIFRNLLTNAMKYNDKPSKWIAIGYVSPDEQEREALGVRREAQEERVEQASSDTPYASRLTPHDIPIFYVRDNGIGIREKHLDTVFGIFKRLHGKDKFGGGTGAGLTMTKKMVERHGGKIWVESTFGEGTTFYFTLEKDHRNQETHHVAEAV